MQESGTSLGAIFHGQSLHKRAVSTFSFAHLGSQLSFTPSWVAELLLLFSHSCCMVLGVCRMGKSSNCMAIQDCAPWYCMQLGLVKRHVWGTQQFCDPAMYTIAQMSHLHHCTLGEPARKSPLSQGSKSSELVHQTCDRVQLHQLLVVDRLEKVQSSQPRVAALVRKRCSARQWIRIRRLGLGRRLLCR